MVAVLMKGYAFNHDIYELLRAFFPCEEIKVIDNKVDFKEGYLIEFTLAELNHYLYGITNIYYNKELIINSKEDISNICIKRSKDKSLNIGVKKSLYKSLIDILDIRLPWGILTGIRPTKIVHRLMEKKIPLNMVFEILTKEYKLDEEKANLIIDISKRQIEYLYPIDNDKYSLYIGIPFCPSRCIYCSYISLPINKFKSLADEYIDKLIYEIYSIKELMSNKKINTVYIGGGTPTSIPLNSLKRIIEVVYDCFGKDNIKEFTVEAGRPDTIDYKMLKMLKSQGVNRISINPQTMNENTLELIGRNHSSEDIINSYLIAKEVGIENINMDLIIGLPGEGVDEVRNTLKRIEDLNPDSITVHTLAVKRGSRFKEQMEHYDVENQNTIEDMLLETKKYAIRNNLKPYYIYRQKQILGNFENIGYSRLGYECIYNISIMEEKETIIGAGVGSTSKIFNHDENRLERIFNFKDVKEYISRIDELIVRKKQLF